MYILVSILLAGIWGFLMGHFLPFPVSFIMAILGGGLLGFIGGTIQASKRGLGF